MTPDAEALLTYWFGEDADALSDAAIAQRQAQLWWGKSDQQDEEIRERFGALAAQAARGELDAWADSARGRLALILALDQLPRVVHRGRPEAFASDHLALGQSLQAQRLREDLTLRPVERVFVYMPMEHAEALPVQDECVHRFEELLAAVPEAEREPFEMFLDFARRHRDVILRFDRFPHRNAILGRASTPAEEAYLAEPGAGF
ncbi:DUF924 family protein [Sediminicurvatus halobius]|uniref:DUF924 domain-containing protein n=1 Tax=Sediminicurvatus halobius TaxID=2182432 RepID=A0A2U2MX16_9GAMM|nr:DUF924 family protein [Spiribacter halobius]PWG61400.1 DUF924 domain-containing protein [Spiribacter halobius]UEX78541.1 DUF924 domain-containing protein [Spiribacter halobius]